MKTKRIRQSICEMQLVPWQDKQEWQIICQKKEREETNKLKMRKATLQQKPLKFRGSQGNILKTYIPTNWKRN
jgi:hypothetical protein